MQNAQTAITMMICIQYLILDSFLQLSVQKSLKLYDYLDTKIISKINNDQIKKSN